VGALSSLTSAGAIPDGSTTRTEAMPAAGDSASAEKVSTALAAPPTAGSAVTSTWANAAAATTRAAKTPTMAAMTRPDHLCIPCSRPVKAPSSHLPWKAMEGHDHDHAAPGRERDRRWLAAALALIAAFMVAEVIVGFAVN